MTDPTVERMPSIIKYTEYEKRRLSQRRRSHNSRDLVTALSQYLANWVTPVSWCGPDSEIGDTSRVLSGEVWK